MKFNHDELIVESLKDLLEETRDALKKLGKNSKEDMKGLSVIGECIMALYEQSQQKINDAEHLNIIYHYFDNTFKNDIVLILKKSGQEYTLTRKDVATDFRAYRVHHSRIQETDPPNKKKKLYYMLKQYIQEFQEIECLWYEGISHAASPKQVCYHNEQSDTHHPIEDICLTTEGAKTQLKNPSIVQRVLLGILFDIMQIYRNEPRNSSKLIIMFQGRLNPYFVKRENLNKLMQQYLAYPLISKDVNTLLFKIKQDLEKEGYRIILKKSSNYNEMYKEKNESKELMLKWDSEKVVFYSNEKLMNDSSEMTNSNN